MKFMINNLYKSILVGLTAGLAIITAPISSFCFLSFSIIWLYFEKVKWYYLLIISLTSSFSAILIWGITIDFNFFKGFIQLSQWGEKGYSTNFFTMVYENPIGNLLLLLTVITNIIILSLTINKNIINKIIFISFIITSIIILSLFKRLEYDYRLLIIFNLTSIIICSNRLLYKYQIAVLGICLISVTYLLSYNIVKPAIVALTWSGDNKYEYNKELFNKMVPKGSSVGGTGNLWTFIDDERFLYADKYIGTSFKPDYMVYRGVNISDSLKYVVSDDWKTILIEEYTLINNENIEKLERAIGNKPLISNFLNLEDTDYRFRLWKKK